MEGSEADVTGVRVCSVIARASAERPALEPSGTGVIGLVVGGLEAVVGLVVV
jgi:hypothetical protein